MIQQERRQGVPTLVFIGPGEFWADEGKIASTESELRRSLIAPEIFLDAYDRFSAQVIYVSPAAREWLGPLAADLPGSYVLMEDRPRIRIIPVDGYNVGVVLFPQASSRKDLDAVFKEALAAGREAAQEANLVIGISPWGSKAERAFAKDAEGLFHVILGGGEGYGFDHAVTGSNNGILWLRPDDQGRSVNFIRLMAWPQPSGQVWEDGVNFTAKLKFLGPTVPADPVIEELFPHN